MKHILSQGPVLAGLGRTLLAGAKRKIFGYDEDLDVPGKLIEREFDPRPGDLIRDYVEHVGGNPDDYEKTLPPHLFPQWGFALAPRTLTDLPYPITRAMNGGCRMQVNQPLPRDEKLHVTAQLVDVDDNGSRAVLKQEIITSTPSVQAGIVAHLFVVIPLGGSSDGSSGDNSTKSDPKQRKQVPVDSTELSHWTIPENAGLDFAKLTGDFNPLHWVSPYAKAAGFPNVILHGFSTMARAYEGLKNNGLSPGETIDVLDVKFTKPLVLPADVGLYRDGDRGIYVGDGPGESSYMSGLYEVS